MPKRPPGTKRTGRRSWLCRLAGALDRYHLFHATGAELLRALRRTAEARDADLRAIELTANPAERALLQERIEGA